MPRKKKTPTGPRSKFAKDLGPLQQLLIRCCPASAWVGEGKDRQVIRDPVGVKSILFLAAWLQIDTYSIYKWIGRGKIPPLRASDIVDIADGRATLADFSPFIYN